MRQFSLFAILATFAAASLFGASLTSGLSSSGKADLKSAGALAFGPDGVLFIGDALGAAVYAVDTQDAKLASAAGPVEIKAIDQKIASLLGTMPDQVLLNDIKVNPISKNIYISVSRGRGPDGVPVILRIDRSGKMTELSLENVRYSMVSLPDAPEANPSAPERRTAEGPGAGDPRAWTITDMSFVDGKVIVAGVSNEEFSSDLRSIPFPFQGAEKGSKVQIWHSQHGQYESQAPIRTFIPYTIDRQQYILATYACTPLVKMPVAALKPGAKVEGDTIAELGEHSTPLEMFPYSKDGKNYILLSNSLRGVMKLSADNLGVYKPIVPPTAECAARHEGSGGRGGRSPQECRSEISGVPYQTVTDLKGVLHMAKADDAHAVLLADSAGTDKITFTAGQAGIYTPKLNGSIDLKTIALP